MQVLNPNSHAHLQKVIKSKLKMSESYLVSMWLNAICIGNHMIFLVQFETNNNSNNKNSTFFQRRPKLHDPVGRVQFVVFERIDKCLFISNCMRKII